jgi:uncharacterized protein YxjI
MSDRDDQSSSLPQRFRVQERVAVIAAERWIEDEHGERVFEVDEMALAKLGAFILRDLHGNEVAKLRHTVVQGDAVTEIMREGARLATVSRARAGLRHHYVIETTDNRTLEVHGHVGRYDYEIRRNEHVIAIVAKKGVHADGAYGVEVTAGEDAAMLLAAAIAIDSMHIS